MTDEIIPERRTQSERRGDDLLAGVLALGSTNASLAVEVHSLSRGRRSTQLLLAAVAVLCVVLGMIFVAYFLNLRTQTERLTRLVETTNSVTNPEAQQQSIARADARADREIFCVTNRVANLQGLAELDPRCLVTFPAPAISSN